MDYLGNRRWENPSARCEWSLNIPLPIFKKISQKLISVRINITISTCNLLKYPLHWVLLQLPWEITSVCQYYISSLLQVTQEMLLPQIVQRLSAILLKYSSASIQLKCKQIKCHNWSIGVLWNYWFTDVVFSSAELMLTASLANFQPNHKFLLARHVNNKRPSISWLFYFHIVKSKQR